MPKNTKTMGLIPRGYGLTLNGSTPAFFSPSRFAEGVIIILPEKEIKRLVKEYSNYPYEDIEKDVKRIHGSYSLLRVEGLKKASAGGTVTTGIIKSRSDGRKKGSSGFRNPTVYNVSIKGLQTLEGKLNQLFDGAGGCEDLNYGKIQDESRNFLVVCSHMAALLQAYQWKDYLSLEDRINYCKPLKEGEIQSPYDFRDKEELLVRYLEKRYIEKKKLFTIDRYLLKEDIITKPFKEGIKEGIVTFNCIKDCENYDHETKYFMDFYSKILSSLGKREGIVLENGKCVWNWKISNKLDVRLIPGNGFVYVMRVVYDREFIKNVEDSGEKAVERYWHLPPTIDDCRRKERIYSMDENPNKDELIYQIGRWISN